MRSLKRTLALLAASLVVSVPALAAAGCGSGAHYLGGVGAHHAINHYATTPKAQRRVNKFFCVYHGHRVLVDLRHHHALFAGLNAVSAYRACTRGFFHRH
jgi:hypothetical protein